MIGELLRRIGESWSALGLAAPPQPSDVAWVVINGGISVQTKLVCLLWTDGGREPRFVVKFARHPQYNARLQAEYSALEEMQSYLPVGPSMVPAPLLTFCLGDLLVTVETAVSGRPLRLYLRERPRQQLRTLHRLEPLVEWLTSMHARSARPATGTDIRSFILEPLMIPEEELGGLSSEEQQGIERLSLLAEKLIDSHTLPLVFNHNDMGATNIMVGEDGSLTGIIDWESGAFGLPASDIIYFLSRYGHETRDVEGEEPLKGFREMFFLPERVEKGVIPISLTEKLLSAYCRRLDVDREWLPLLFGITWILHARNERRRLMTESGSAYGEPAATKSSLDTDRTVQKAHFRSHLRYFLENWDSSLVVATAKGSMR